MPRKASPKPVELDRSRTPLIVAIVLVVGIGLTVGSIMWGTADSGQIDVSATIVNSQSGGQGGESDGSAPVSAPAQEYVDMPNGGLVPAASGDSPAPEPEQVPEEVASTTATTTDAVTTEEGSTESAQETTDAGVLPQTETESGADGAPTE